VGHTGALTFTGRLDRMRTFYRTYPEWVVIQVFLLIASPVDGFAVGRAFTGTVGQVIGAIVGLVVGLVATFYLPPWRETFTEHRHDALS
jgi:uncharacterized membrane protein YccC